MRIAIVMLLFYACIIRSFVFENNNIIKSHVAPSWLTIKYDSSYVTDMWTASYRLRNVNTVLDFWLHPRRQIRCTNRYKSAAFQRTWRSRVILVQASLQNAARSLPHKYWISLIPSPRRSVIKRQRWKYDRTTCKLTLAKVHLHA